MYSYLVTLFVRFFVAFSGFLVFIVSSKLFGAQGRGLIGYGSSLASIFGLVLSFNLGRSFLAEAKKYKNSKLEFLPSFLILNYFLIFVGVVAVIVFWLLNDQAQSIINIYSLLGFLVMVPYYVWLVNGGPIYASLNETKKQDYIILIVRLILIGLMLGILLFFNHLKIEVFILIYGVIVGFGALFEVAFLGNPCWMRCVEISQLWRYVRLSKNAHLDYLAFNLYPLVLMVLSAPFLKLHELGKFNFVVQLVNFIFIMSIAASLRLKTYVSSAGVMGHATQIKRLLFFTSLCTAIAIGLIDVLLGSSAFNEHFSSFGGVSSYFLIVGLAAPGYIAYQFLYPALIEYDRINLSMNANLIIFATLVLIAYPTLNQFGLLGACALFATFYLLVFVSQCYIFLKIRHTFTRS